MYTYSGEQLKDVINYMSDDERYRLLATLRTGELITERERQLRWYFLRGIVIRAFQKKSHYFIGRVNDWHDSSSNGRFRNGMKPSINYYSEVGHILDLAEYIKNYNQDLSVPNAHIIAVKKALKAYYLNFSMMETHGYLADRGVSFRTNNRKGEYKPVIIRELAYYEYLLRTAEFDLVGALKLWEQEHSEKYNKWLRGETRARYVYPVTPARLLNTYAKLVRHLTARSVGVCPTFTDLTEEFRQYRTKGEEDFTIEDLGVEIKPALPAWEDVASYLDNLKVQSRYANQKIWQQS